MIHVVAGVLIDADDRILIAQRPPGKYLAGGWEFPGGKLAAGESRLAGLARELREELGVEIGPCQRPLLRLSHTYAHGAVLLDVFVVRQFSGVPRGLDGQALRWCAYDELSHAELLPADGPIVRALQLPERLLSLSGRGYRIMERLEPGELGQNTQLVGVICESLLQAVNALDAGACFIVITASLPGSEVAAFCSHVSVPVFVRGFELEEAWRLGASGVTELV